MSYGFVFVVIFHRNVGLFCSILISLSALAFSTVWGPVLAAPRCELMHVPCWNGPLSAQFQLPFSHWPTAISNEYLWAVLEFSCFHVHQTLYCFFCCFPQTLILCRGSGSQWFVSNRLYFEDHRDTGLHLRGTVGLVPGHHNKANIAVKSHMKCLVSQCISKLRLH